MKKFNVVVIDIVIGGLLAYALICVASITMKKEPPGMSIRQDTAPENYMTWIPRAEVGPQSVTLKCDHGDITIDVINGRVLMDHCSTDEAARVFWKSIAKHLPRCRET